MTKSNNNIYKKVDQVETELVVVDAERVNDDAPPSAPPAKSDPYSDDSTITGEDEQQDGNMLARGAAALCGLTGCIFGGPFLAILAGLFGAYSATHNEGPVGDASRAIGEVALAASAKAKEAQVREKSGKAFKTAANGLKESIRGRRSSTSTSTSQNPKAEVL